MNSNVYKLLHLALLLLAGVVFLPSCRQPVLTSIYPSSGPPSTLVHVTGENLEGCVIKLDAGTLNERTLEGGFFKANFFTVPDVSLGYHTVSIIRDRQSSENVLRFKVTGGTRRPAPRIDDITCRMFRVGRDGKVFMLLLVHGANIDAGAKVQIGGVQQPSWLWRAISNRPNMIASNPATLGYPIFHYGTLLCPIGNLTPGDTIRNITIRNTNGAVSINTFKYKIADNPLTLDSDGDGLTDSAEVNGVDADSDGVIDIDLRAAGAHPLHKDLFLEVDYMEGLQPAESIWRAFDSIFRNAPVLNSDGTQGIVMHVDRGQGGVGYSNGGRIPYYDYITLGDTTDCPKAVFAHLTTCAYFYTLKARHFDRKRLGIYRYCICGNYLHPGYAGGQAYRDDMIVITKNTNPFLSAQEFAEIKVSTFLHEFGHTLGLHHGGRDHLQFKPNYNSIMNYTFNREGIDLNCNHRDTESYRVYNYSQGMRKSLNENCLNEADGICDNVPIDWNGNGINNETCIRAHIHRDPGHTILYDHCDWNNLTYKIGVLR